MNRRVSPSSRFVSISRLRTCDLTETSSAETGSSATTKRRPHDERRGCACRSRHPSDREAGRALLKVEPSDGVLKDDLGLSS